MKELQFEYSEIVKENEKKDFSVLADENHFQNQVFENLLSNAIKFSHTGKTIKFIVESVSDKVLIHFIDQGIGIPEKHLESIFDHEYKRTRLGLNGEKGIGLGLPMVKFYIEQSGGTLEVKSYPINLFPDNHGTHFIVKMKKVV